MNEGIFFRVLLILVVLCGLLSGGCIDSGYIVPPEIVVEEGLVAPDRAVSEEEKQRLTVRKMDDGREVVVFTIIQAVDRAVRHNIQILNIYDLYQVAEFNLRGAKADFLIEYTPSIIGNVSGEDGDRERLYQFNITKKNSFGTIGDVRISAESLEDEKKSDVRFSLDQPLLKGAGKLVTTNNVINARRDLATTLRAIELSKERLVFSVISNYYDIIREREIVALNEKSAERMRRLLEQSRQKEEVDLVSELDVLQAEIQLAGAEDNLIEARQSLGDDLDHFKILLGFSEEVEIDIDGDTSFEEVKVDEAEAIVVALANRLDYVEARDKIWDAERNQRVAKNMLLPTLDIVVGYTFSGEGDGYSDAFAYNDSSWFLGFSTTTDIRRVAERADYMTAQIETKNAKRDVVLLKDQILRQVRQDIRRLDKNLKRIRLQKRTMEHAENQFKLAQLKYSERLKIDIFDVTRAEEDRILAETNYILAVTDYLTAQARLKMTLGTLTEKSPEVYNIGYFAD